MTERVQLYLIIEERKRKGSFLPFSFFFPPCCLLRLPYFYSLQLLSKGWEAAAVHRERLTAPRVPLRRGTRPRPPACALQIRRRRQQQLPRRHRLKKQRARHLRMLHHPQRHQAALPPRTPILPRRKRYRQPLHLPLPRRRIRTRRRSRSHRPIQLTHR